jgi:hypothetical protein
VYSLNFRNKRRYSTRITVSTHETTQAPQYTVEIGVIAAV